MDSKKTILISWTSHMFREVMVPIIEKLSKKFYLVVTLVDYHINEELLNELNNYKTNNVLKAYYILPEYNQVKDQFRYLKKNTEPLKKYAFDYWLTAGEVTINEKYISEFVIPKKCFTIVLAHTVTYLFEQPDILKYLIPKDLALQKCEISNDKMNQKNNTKKAIDGLSKISIIQKLINFESRHLFLLFPILKSRIEKILKLFVHQYYDRIFLPFLMFGKTFNYEKFDKLTQIGSGKSDLFLFTDTLEVKAHKYLFKKKEIQTVQYPSLGSCWCLESKNEKKNVLILLGGVFMAPKILDKILELFLRDSKIVMAETNANCIHLRPHPRMRNNNTSLIQDFLIKNGIPTEVNSEKTIRENMCKYMGIAGVSSNGLRDARASCENAFVVAFEAVSKYRYKYPKILFGIGEGIGWINEDGSYDPQIFKVGKFVPPKRKSVSDIIYELSESRNILKT